MVPLRVHMVPLADMEAADDNEAIRDIFLHSAIFEAIYDRDLPDCRGAILACAM